VSNITPSLTIIGGSTIVVTFVGSASSSASASASSRPVPPPSDSSGLGTGSIIGLSVAGGVALIGIIAFFVWKFTRKQKDFDDSTSMNILSFLQFSYRCNSSFGLQMKQLNGLISITTEVATQIHIRCL
jgi:hypothetical protein